MNDERFTQLADSVSTRFLTAEVYEFPEGLLRGNSTLFELTDAMVPHLLEDAEVDGQYQLDPGVKEFLEAELDANVVNGLERLAVLSLKVGQAETSRDRELQFTRFIGAASMLKAMLAPPVDRFGDLGDLMID
ncbi:MAG: hypothetical protein R3313_03090 [Candidatus Saccharimonadales bacterium]|nr:hypothetical protein [Candidatus Saccharimonadales bacterium]